MGNSPSIEERLRRKTLAAPAPASGSLFQRIQQTGEQMQAAIDADRAAASRIQAGIDVVATQPPDAVRGMSDAAKKARDAAARLRRGTAPVSRGYSGSTVQRGIQAVTQPRTLLGG